MEIKFSKMHGLGNDFVVFCDCDILPKDKISFISNRKIGIGCDQVIFINTKTNNVRFFNADGSEAETCGNGLRCCALMLSRIHNRNEFSILTKSGTIFAKITTGNTVSVNMGKWDIIEIDPELTNKHPTIIGAVSVGNPHIILRNDETLQIEVIGPILENSFLNKINVSLVDIQNSKKIILKVWERGVGITEACGSAACASVAILNSIGLLSNSVDVIQNGGALHIDINNDGSITQSGEAYHVFDGLII